MRGTALKVAQLDGETKPTGIKKGYHIDNP